MYKADWRSPAAYLPLQQYGRAGFAWEIVRRDPDYAYAYQRLDRREPPKTDASEPSARRWGLRAFADPNVDCDRQPIFWLPEVLPTVLHLQPARTELTSNPLEVGAAIAAQSAQAHRSGQTTDVLIAQLTAPHRLYLDQDTAGAMAVVIPLDRLFDYRAAAALNLWRALKGLRPLADPMPLSPFARGQLILVIRLLDAERDGASEREAAAVVLNAKADNRRAWIGSEHRARLRRLLARGHKLLAGGYFQLLNPPPRRRRGS
jgi:hypothetical protein